MTGVADALARYPGAVTFTFGDSRELCDEILALVRAGRKTVTCGCLAAVEVSGEGLPEVGRVDVALDWDGVPALAVETVAVRIVPFDEVTEEMVPDQGEFADLADWRAGYRAYLERAGYYAPDAKMVIERFRVVEDFGPAAGGAEE